jgi:D-alanine-D-alanine ligase-like ATP-grasp enzyme
MQLPRINFKATSTSTYLGGSVSDDLARNPTVTQAILRVLCIYSFIKRAFASRFRPGVVRMRTHRARFYSAMWRGAADAIGACYARLPGDGAQISKEGLRLQVFQNQTSLEDPAAVARASDKLVVHDLLAHTGIAVTRQTIVKIGEIGKALDILKTSVLPLVVKPAANTGAGAGVSTCVRTPRQLLTAIAWARAYGPRILIERQIPGSCYRVLVMDGEVLDTVMRLPPSVRGDGISTVRQLVRHENKLRRGSGASRGQVLIRIDPDLRNTIMNQGFTLDSRPPAGEVVVLKHVVNDNGTAENVSANDCLCEAIVESARNAARLVGIRLAGVDIICQDPQVPLESSDGAIIEVNANPGLYYHYHPTDSGFPLAEEVLKRYFERPLLPRTHTMAVAI